MNRTRIRHVAIFSTCALAVGSFATAQDVKPQAGHKPAAAANRDPAGATAAGATGAGTTGAAQPVPLNPEKTVLMDRAGKRLLLKTRVCLREGVLEMLLCRIMTKEHESILTIDAEAYVIHGGLLALGAKPGGPVQFEPEFQPPRGTQIDLFVQWKDADGTPHRRPAQDWIRHVTRRFYVHKLEALPSDLKLPEDSRLKYDRNTNELYWFGPMTADEREAFLKLSQDKKYREIVRAIHDAGQSRPMDLPWVFAGSGFYVDEDTKQRYYLAESGDLICVANFGSAMLDVAARSSADGTADLLFEAYAERIPPLGTEVTLELVVQTAPQKKTGQPASAPQLDSKPPQP